MQIAFSHPNCVLLPHINHHIRSFIKGGTIIHFHSIKSLKFYSNISVSSFGCLRIPRREFWIFSFNVFFLISYLSIAQITAHGYKSKLILNVRTCNVHPFFQIMRVLGMVLFDFLQMGKTACRKK